MSSTQIRNLQSCRVSIPPLLKQTKNAKGKKVYTWKTDLLSTEKLSFKFLFSLLRYFIDFWTFFKVFSKYSDNCMSVIVLLGLYIYSLIAIKGSKNNE